LFVGGENLFRAAKYIEFIDLIEINESFLGDWSTNRIGDLLDGSRFLYIQKSPYK